VIDQYYRLKSRAITQKGQQHNLAAGQLGFGSPCFLPLSRQLHCGGEVMLLTTDIAVVLDRTLEQFIATIGELPPMLAKLSHLLFP